MQREQRANKNLSTAKPSPNFAAAKKFDPDKLHPTLPNMLPARDGVDPGPLKSAKVARGRTLHLDDPNGKKRIVGSRPYEANGVTMYHDVTAVEFRVANPGEIVTLPQTEIDRLIGLGFLQSIDESVGPRQARSVTPDTGVENDPRLANQPPPYKGPKASLNRTRTSP